MLRLLYSALALVLIVHLASGAAPHILARYEVELGCKQSFPAHNCEFWVDGIAQTKTGYQGWSETGLHVELVTRTSEKPSELVLGQLLSIKNLSAAVNQTEDLFMRGQYDTAHGRWLFDTVTQRILPPMETMSPNLVADSILFVLKRIKDETCLWLTNVGGEAFPVDATFAPPVYPEFIGRKQFVWANQRVALFNQKHACVH